MLLPYPLRNPEIRTFFFGLNGTDLWTWCDVVHGAARQLFPETQLPPLKPVWYSVVQYTANVSTSTEADLELRNDHHHSLGGPKQSLIHQLGSRQMPQRRLEFAAHS